MKRSSAQLLLVTALVFGESTMMAVPIDTALVNGERLYRNYCQRCHGTNGEGSFNILRSDVWAKQPTDLVKVIAFGARGPSSSGKGYHRAMPPAPYNDAEIAQVAMYAMQTIGRREVVLSEAEVRRTRQLHLDSIQRKIKSRR
ncbi:MAG: cytochrome c [Candidatus Kapabacteria bacterium]|nr:cytochrome c [Candidatus Kapabacteria bacterium]